VRVSGGSEAARPRVFEEPVFRARLEYRCPYCGTVNVRYEPAGRLVCDWCRKTFYPAG